MQKIIVLVVFLISSALLHASENKTIKKVPFSGNFILSMSKNDEMCRHFLDKFQNDIKQYGGLKPENHDEFKLDWRSFKYTEFYSSNKSQQHKIVDLNHDGKDEIVIFKEFSAFADGEEPYVDDTLMLYELSEHNIQVLKSPIKNGRAFFKDMKNQLYYISSAYKGIELKEFPIRKIQNVRDETHISYPYIQLIYDGLRVMKFKEKDYFVMFGNSPQDGMATIHFKDVNIFDKTMVVISKVDSEIKRQSGSRIKSYGREDICYYLKVK